MAGEYNASAKFESSQAERGINSLAGKIDNLKTRLQGAASAGKQFDSVWASASRSMGTATAKAKQMETSLSSVNRGARGATTAIRGLAGALNTGEMARAAGVIRSLGTHLTTTGARMRQIRTHATGLQSSLGAMGRLAVAGALGIERLGKALAITIPKMMQGSSAAKSLAASLGFLQRSYRLNVTGLGQVSTALRRGQMAQTGMNSAQRSGIAAAGKYSHALHGVESSLLGLGSGLAGVRNLGLAWLAGMGLSGLVQMADTFKLTQARLSLVAEGMSAMTAAQNALMESSNRTRTGYRENVNLFTKMAQAGEAYGLSLTKSLVITENVQKAFKISGATTGEAQAASQQLAQGFASGRLQGDELRSILENAPRLGRALSEHLGIPLGEIRKRAKEGEIGINELVKAFGNAAVTAELTEEFSKIPVTIGDAMTVAGNKLMEFVGKVDAAGGISAKVAKIIIGVANNFEAIGIAAGIAAVGIMGSYVPAIINATKASRIFLGLRFAAYGAGVAQSMGAAAGAVGLLGGAFRRSATSTLPHWKQVVGNVTGGALLLIQQMGKGFASVFMRLPAIFAIGTVALYAFNDDTRIVSGQLATTQDYLVTGFQAAWSAIAGIVSSVSDFITRKINDTIDNMIWAVDALYRLGKMGAGVGIGVAKVAASLAPGGVKPQDAIKSLSDQSILAYGKDGIRADFGKAVSGTRWAKAANARATDRWSAEQANQPWFRAIMMNGGITDDTLTPGAVPGDKVKKPKKERQKKDRTAEEMKRVRGELDRLNASFSDAEKARQEFNDGLKTLGEALNFGMINADQLNDSLRRLAHETFPGLRDEMKTLQQENKDLIIKARGGTESDVAYAQAKDTIDEQIRNIDIIIEKQGDVHGILEGQKQVLREQLGTYGQMRTENEDLIKLADARKAKEEEIARIMEDGWTQMSDLFNKTIDSMLGKGKFSFKSFFGDILAMGRDMFTQMLNVHIMQPLKDKFTGILSGIFSAKGKAPVGSQAAIGDALAGATGGWKDLKDIITIPPIKIDISGKGTTASTGTGGNVELNVNGQPKTGAGEDIVVTARRPERMGFFPAMVSGYKKSWDGTLKDLGKLFKPVGELFKKAGEKLGISGATMDKVGAKIGKAFAGAQKGMMINEVLSVVGSKLGFKTSKTGAAIGGALGSFLPIPGGDIIGSIVGSIVGGLFKKTKKASISVSTGSDGRFSDNKASGNSKKMEGAVTAMASSVKSGIYAIAEQLGGDVRSNFNLGTIKMKKDKFIFNGKKYASEAEAIEAMVKNALRKGIITGLSETSDRVLRTMKDTDRAIQIVQVIENVKKQAAAIRNPAGALFTDLQKDITDTLKMFAEARASAADYADLSVVAAHKFNEIVTATLKELTDFRFDLTGGNLSYLTPADRLAASSSKFDLIEADLAAGKAVDNSVFTSAAGELVSLARDVFGSTPEFAEYQKRVLSATDAMITAAQATINSYQPMIDALLAQTEQARKDAETTNGLLQGIYNNTTGGSWKTDEYNGADRVFNAMTNFF